jgi:fumarylacetoacetate (FAA) hydrolase
MKLASLNDGSRDGQLVVVSRDLMTAHYATGVADHLQQVLDDWNFMAPQLQDLYDTLNHGKARHAFPLDVRLCMAPLPRAHLLALADAYRGPTGVEDANAAPVLGFSDELAGPTAPLCLPQTTQVADFAAGWAVLTGDVPAGVSPLQALESVRLLMLVNHMRVFAEPSGPTLAAKPWSAMVQSAFSPVAVTPDELASGGESAWQRGRLNLTLQCSLNGRKLGVLDAGQGMHLHAGELIAALGQHRRLRAGAIVCMGEVRHSDKGLGHASLSARRKQELAQGGIATTPWLAAGDTVLIEMKGRDGMPVFGDITQKVVALESARRGD